MDAFSLVHIAPLRQEMPINQLSHSQQLTSLPTAPSYLCGRPHLSAILLLVLSSGCCYLIAHLITTRPSIAALFSARQRRRKSVSLLDGDDDANAAASSRNGLEEPRPSRPGRWGVMVLAGSLAIRVELFLFVRTQQHCRSFGFEFWLWPALVVYQYTSSRDKLQSVKYGDADNPWHSEFHDWVSWIESDKMRHVNHLIISFLFAVAASAAANQFAPSPYMCIPSIDSPSLVSYSHMGMLLLDITIAILSWQQLTWGKQAKDHLKTASKVLALGAFSILVFDTLRSFRGFVQDTSGEVALTYNFNIMIDSLALSVLIISASLWICDTNLTGPVGILTSIAGLWQVIVNAGRYGEWDYLDRAPVLLPLFVATGTTICFTYAQHLRNVVHLPRGLFNWVVFLIALVTTLHALLATVPVYDGQHPINQIMYDSEISYRHWLVKGSTSSTSSTAIRIYEDRHGGRKAPPQYKEWYAQLRRAKIRDNFPQIDEDLEPFWHLSPAQVRAAVEEAAQLPGVATIVIKNGEASIGRNDAGGAGADVMLTRLVHMANNFSSHLPDMTLPINLAKSPRILPRWEARRSYSRASDDAAAAAAVAAAADVIAGRSARQAEMSALAHETHVVEERGTENEGPGSQNAISAAEFRAMLRQACPPNSASRANPYWNTAGFCRGCARGHSSVQLMSDWEKSLDSLCSQPDLKNLHGFYMTAPDVRPVQKLLPLFSLYKAAHFADILLPLWPEEAAPAEAGEVGDALDEPFLDRSDNVSWAGSIGQNPITPEYLRGHHKLRLLGQLTLPRATDKTTLIKPIMVDEVRRWLYAKRSTAAVNSKLPLDVGISDYTACAGHNCDAVKQLFGGEFHLPRASDRTKIVLLLDEDNGPSAGTLRALRTETMPVISTIFKTWYTSRLRPWVHFAPLDVRYQALHTTLSYFTVLEDRRDSGVMDSRGIAQQGKSWAKEALRERDQELYFSRLLMEWARLIDDRRDELGVSTAAAPVKHG
ncbi:capsular associated protein [Cordyceps fumosorosea ARSEF 2679]|uniref:Capsular associated protein n=1 Tax=Cordyceps fumosorosea (strain ARSEF 2679) TaxID=1081104 RepID=A0A167NYJ6_CORFA|nr:capsular associated protein [Cordyceps fumosorosea ARSEF 2679]OAA56089.1 capsular associated protein [Cordyceps fumosorosea ARSEF 2679]